jgi:hypothetical protein
LSDQSGLFIFADRTGPEFQILRVRRVQ